MEPAVPLSRFSPRLGDWRETDGQEEADAAEPESWTHRHELNPVNPVDCKAGGSLWEKIALQFFFRLNPCRNYRR